ncbi:biotin carboxylase [Catenulispora subtropica]|uniref:ATP-grasp domain-containing protein n=1 Tax=Catenulispora subtropica TaxID=450798 RepID=A0ABP5CE47_9ACTN
MRPHVVVIHRWRARYAEYERYVDHRENAVSYITTEVGACSVTPLAAAVALVEATDDQQAVGDRIHELAADLGKPAAIIALKEDDLLVAARLRAEWGCSGPTEAELLPFRDKLLMAEAVAAAGVAVPAFTAVRTADDVRAFGARHGWPVIVKPRIGSSSAGVVHLTGPEDCSALDFSEPVLAQAYDPRQIYHVDGCFDGTSFGPFRAARYLNTTPLGFREGTCLGSVEEDDPELARAIGTFGSRALAALTDQPTVFHLEVFVDRETGACAFLEVGARVGGGEIPFVWREIHGYDLMEAGFRLGLGLDPKPWSAALSTGSSPGSGAGVGGFLLVPAPAARPCRITTVTSMLGREPGPYAEALLTAGEILPAADAYYEHVGGRFRFRGTTAAEVEAAIIGTARDFRVSAEPLAA